MCTIQEFRRWFNRYVDGFLDGPEDGELRSRLELKRDHTFRVCKIAKGLGERLELIPQDLFIVEVAALFHDIGRFSQYFRYRTFSDVDSENHARLGEGILKELGIAGRLGGGDETVLLQAVGDHNLPRYPGDTVRPNTSERAALVTRIIRDADKIDIYEITCNLYEGGLQAITGLASGNGLSETVCRTVLDGKTVMWKMLATGNDFKIMQLGWALDINFIPAIELILEKGYLRRIKETLPSNPLVERLYDTVTAAVTARLKDRSSSRLL